MKFSQAGLWLLSFFILSLSLGAAEKEKIEPNKESREIAGVLTTPQGKLIRALFAKSENVHLIALSVNDEPSFIQFKKQLGEVESELNAILLKLEKMAPLSQADQVELRSLLKKEEVRIGKVGEQASRHAVSLKNVLLGQKLQQEQKSLFERISPELSKQSARHYKPRKKAK